MTFYDLRGCLESSWSALKFLKNDVASTTVFFTPSLDRCAGVYEGSSLIKKDSTRSSPLSVGCYTSVALLSFSADSISLISLMFSDLLLTIVF